MERINKILLPSLAKRQVGKAAKSAMVCFYAEKWGNNHFQALSFTQGILKVSVKSSSQAMDLDMKKDQLIKFIQEKFKIQIKIKIIQGS